MEITFKMRLRLSEVSDVLEDVSEVVEDEVVEVEEVDDSSSSLGVMA